MNRLAGYSFIPLLLSAFLLSSCGIKVVKGSGDITREDRSVSGFDSIEFSGFGRLLVSQGDEETLSIEVDDNLLQYINTEVVGNTLMIDFDDNVLLRPADSIIFRLSVIDLKSIDVSGAGSFEVGELAADTLDVTMSGAGKIDIDSIEAAELRVVVNGAGSIDIAGTVDTQEIDVSGVGDFNALDLESEQARVNISGAGDADLWVHEVLSITISGAGSVSYYGDPEVSQSVSGLGSVKSRGER